MVLHTVIYLPTFKSPPLHGQYSVPNKVFAFISQAPWAGTKPELPDEAVTRPELTLYQKVLSGPIPLKNK